jgi:hypothetical protein
LILLHELLSDYSAGLRHARRLESRLKADWEQKLLQTGTLAQQKHQRALQDLNLYEKARQANYQKRMHTWKEKEKEKDQRYRSKLELWQKREETIQHRHEVRLAKWREETIRPARKAANLIWLGSIAAFLFGCGGCCIFFYLPLNSEGRNLYLLIPFLIYLASAFLFIRGIHQEIQIRRLRDGAPPRPTSSERPQREPKAREPKLDPQPPRPILEDPPNLDLIKRWLLAINAKALQLPEYMPETHGKHGEEDLFLLFAENLSDEYMALRNLMLRRTLDADLILIGPTGIWLFDSKYWSGLIRYRPSGWEREKALSRNDISPEDYEVAPDLGWGNQKRFVMQAFEWANLHFDWEKAFKGGIAFTHPNCELDIGQTCPVAAGSADGWLRLILGSTEIPGFTLDLRMRAADALCIYSAKPRREQIADFQASPSALLADQVYQQLLNGARQYHEKHQNGY